MAASQPEHSPTPDAPTDSEILQLFADEGLVALAEVQGRAMAAFARPLLAEKGWTQSMVVEAVTVWVDGGYLSGMEAED